MPFILFLFLYIYSFAQSANDQKIPLDPAVQYGKLPNGLTYYIRENKKPEQRVELRLVVNVGSILEDDNQLGLAHFIEHMAFNGTKNFEKNELVSFLQKMGVRFGADLNAYTSFDETVYMLPIPLDNPENLEKGFQVLEDWAHNLTFDHNEIDKERGVVLEESRLGKGADDRMFKQYQKQLFAGSKYADRLPIGTDEILKNAPYETIKQYYRDWYRPDLMAVLVVGDIDAEKVHNLVQKHFGSLANPHTPRPRTYAGMPPRATTEAAVVTDKEATNYLLQVIFDALPSKDQNSVAEYKNHLLRNLFNNMLGSRLRELTQSENPPFVFGAAGYGEFVRGYEGFNMFAALGNSGVQSALQGLFGTLESVKKFGFTDAELDRAKKSLLNGLERSFNERDKTESDRFVDEYIRNFLSGESVPGIAKELEYAQLFLPGIKLGDISALVTTMNLDKNRFIVLTGPESGNLQLPDNAGLLAMYQTISSQEAKPYEEKVLATALMAKPTNAGKVVKESMDEKLGAIEWTLSNGIVVTIKTTTYKNDEIVMSAIRKGGTNNYDLTDKYNAQFATRLVGEMGVGNFSPTDIRKVNAGKTAFVGPSISSITSGFRGGCSVKDFETMLQLVHLYSTAPRKDEKLFHSFKEREIAQWSMMSANPQFAFADTLNKIRYAGNPLAPEFPTPATYNKINLDRAMEIYKECLGDAGGMQFTFVGNIDLVAAKPLIEAYLGSLPSTGKEPQWRDNGVEMVKGQKEFNLHKGEEPKSQISITWHGIAAYDEGLQFQLRAVTELLNIRVIEKLREELSGIYGGGFSGSISRYPRESYNISLSLPCGPENVDTLVKAAYQEIETLKKNGPKPEDLEKVKQQWREAHKVNVQENSYWLSQLQSIHFFDSDPERVLQYEKFVDALTAADVQKTAQVLFDGQNVFKAVLYPEK